MIVTTRITLQTQGECDIIDITPQVAQHLAATTINSGIATLFVAGSTAALSTIEFEPGLVADFQNMWQRNVPRGITYHHDRRWGDGNGYSHIRASLLGPSLVVPFADKKLTLGTWQQVVLVDFDNRPRSREIVLQIIGE